MSRFFTFRRFLVYSAYFTGAFSLLIGLFISKHAWALHKTVRLVEKSWDVRGTNYSNASWIDKASHALLAGHEDVSEYNDLFWAKYNELGRNGTFDRSNLTACEPGYEPEWATANAGYDKWGFVMYRTDYEDDDEQWKEDLQHINHTIRAHLELEATHEGKECDPDYVRDRAVIEIIEDREALQNATLDDVRDLWRKRVDDGLVEKSFKMGGWQWGWFRVNLGAGRSDDNVEDGSEKIEKANGLSLNLCLVYNWHTRTMMQLMHGGIPATGPRDPWEPFLVAVDGMWSPDKYMYLTSWAHEYPGAYGVALSLLFNNFHGRTFEREMERQSPYLWMGGPIVDHTAPWWKKAFQVLLGTTYAVARPGQFPFHDRIQEIEYPFVREDSHWKLPETVEKPGPAEMAAEDDKKWADFLVDRHPDWYTFCHDTDENQDDCFQMGNFRVRHATQHHEVASSATELGEQEPIETLTTSSETVLDGAPKSKESSGPAMSVDQVELK